MEDVTNKNVKFHKLDKPSKPAKQIEMKKLRNKRSRLDMLDNSQLTSFPLAPPLNLRSPSTSTTSTTSTPAKCPNTVSMSTSTPIKQKGPANTRIVSIKEPDPIILIEDYLQPKQLKHKKLSVLDLKKSVKTFDVCEAPSQGQERDTAPAQGTEQNNYLFKVKHILSESMESSLRRKQSQHLLTTCDIDDSKDFDDSADISEFSATAIEDHDEFFSAKTSQSNFSTITPSLFSSSSIKSCTTSTTGSLKLGYSSEFAHATSYLSTPEIKSNLKYCVICDTPLYEISSYLKDKPFKEFVCCNCTEKYEALSDILQDFEQNLQSIMEEEEASDDAEDADDADYSFKCRKLNDQSAQFSKTLISRLKTQLDENIAAGSSKSTSTVDNDAMLWYIEAKKKLRWRWRVSGLIPKFVSK